jgi:SOS-response transcriptional repressor LexA
VIEQSIAESGSAPSYDEIGKAIGLASKSGVHRLVTGLEDRGMIRRIPGRARAIEIVDGGGTDTLAFLTVEIRDRVRSIARRKGVLPEAVVADICRAHFARTPA